MAVSTLHTSSIVIDGLVVSRWSREVFEAMQRGGLTAVNCTCSIWEGTRDTMLNMARWNRYFDEYGDLIMPIRRAGDIRKAKELGKVGILLGWQNTAGIEDRIDFLPLFKDMGLRVIQLTYNTQNLVGAGCWEANDSGLSGFGREVVEEMNRLRLLVDLSHVGQKTASDAIAHSQRGCAYTHVAPYGLFNHARNKTDEQLREIVNRGGFVGVATYPPFMKSGADTTLDDCVELFEYMINVCGEENIGIGTDFTQDHDEAFFDYLRQDKGYARRANPGRGKAPTVKGMDTLADYPKLTDALERRGWSETRIRRVLGENWLRFLEQNID
ncbi:membrane dipeptidase [Bordetella sp. BOR01]|uniref:membrane dipeptidase n=1 Tax=Bordetella sp. BOR01 TaxID=2854779 RepID=UPI001C441215|nr:membrane dipeptidase [Bordetella sp. BOR01]MBV7483843.1 dipeptidase [Bordetella sp. BOR01]